MHRDEIFDHCLVLGMQGLLYHILACMFYNLISEKTLQMNLQLLVLYIPLVLYAFIRKKCAGFFVFMLSHAAVLFAFFLLLPEGEMQFIVCGCVAVMAVSSFCLRTASGEVLERCPSAASVATFLAVYIIAGYMERSCVMQFSYYEAFLFLILFAIHKNLENTAGFLKSSEGIANLPSGQIKGMNRMLLVLFLLFLTAAMILLQYLPAGYLLQGTGGLLLLILRSVVKILIWIFSRETRKPDISSSIANEPAVLPEAGGASVLLQILDSLIRVAASLAIVAGAVYLTARIFYELYQRFYEQQKESADESEFLWKLPLENMKIKDKRQKNENMKNTGTNHRIRRIYKKSIRRQYGRKTTVPSYLAPLELEADIAAKKEDQDLAEAVRQRTALYEKARYSQHECEKQELEMMKQMTYGNSSGKSAHSPR